MLRDKGVVEFVEAARQVKVAHPELVFRLIGGLDSNPAAIGEEEIAGWVREGIVEWVGHVPVRPWLERTSVFVLPSYREGVPRSTQEAMAMARPVITTDVPGCRETVVDGRNGYLVPARDSGALAAAMLRFVANPALVNQMGPESRRMAEQRFDAAALNAKTIAAMRL
jgi:glycosyltransferase involved in cell wall biosynthesis